MGIGTISVHMVGVGGCNRGGNEQWASRSCGDWLSRRWRTRQKTGRGCADGASKLSAIASSLASTHRAAFEAAFISTDHAALSSTHRKTFAAADVSSVSTPVREAHDATDGATFRLADFAAVFFS
jgi:hypothetical protein